MSQFENDETIVHDIENEVISTPELKLNEKSVVSYEEKTAGFWIRFWAFFFDSMIVGAIVGVLVNPIFYFMDWSLDKTNWYAPMAIISGLFNYSYFVLMTKIWQQTIGKMILGIKIKTINGEKLNWSTVLFREVVGRFINNTIPVIYIMVAFMPKNQGIHDLISDTMVVQEKVYIKKDKKITFLPESKDDILNQEDSITSSI